MGSPQEESFEMRDEARFDMSAGVDPYELTQTECISVSYSFHREN